MIYTTIMADTFEKILVKDDKIGCLTNKVKYAVNEGRAEYHRHALQGYLATPPVLMSII
jgi:hypothetical protein